MNEAWTKNGSSPFRSSHEVTRLHQKGRLRLLGREPGRRPRRAVPVGTRVAGDRAGRGRGAGPARPPPGRPATCPIRGCRPPRGRAPRAGTPGAHPRRSGVVDRRRGRSRVDAGVGVAEQHRVVAGLAGQQGHVGEAGVEGRAVVDRPVVVQVGAGVEAGPRRAARGGVGPVVGEQGAPGGQAVEGGGGEHRVAQRREAVAPPLVDGDEQDVAVHRPDPPPRLTGPPPRIGSRRHNPSELCRSLRWSNPMIRPEAHPHRLLGEVGNGGPAPDRRGPGRGGRRIEVQRGGDGQAAVLVERIGHDQHRSVAPGQEGRGGLRPGSPTSRCRRPRGCPVRRDPGGHQVAGRRLGLGEAGRRAPSSRSP